MPELFKNKYVKIAFVDSVTGEFYFKENSSTESVFTRDVSKAKLYIPRSDVREIFDYVSQQSGRNLKCVEVEVTFDVLGDSSYLDQLNNREFELYKKLNAQAENDIDSMNEGDYRKWKTLRSKFRGVGLIQATTASL
jgi:hypothetical protein